MGRMIENNGRDTADIRRYNKATTNSNVSSAINHARPLLKSPLQASNESVVTLAGKGNSTEISSYFGPEV